MKYSMFIIILLFCSSCATNTSIVGLYGKCGKSYYACTQIQLKSDKTFEYFIYMDVGGGAVIKGNWEQIAADSIKLNTYKQPKNPVTTYKGKINPNRTNTLKITIQDWEVPLAYADIIINEDKVTSANTNGIAEFETTEVKTITYHYLGLTETIKIDNPNYNEIEITVKDLDLNAVPQFLTDKIMIVNSRKLFFVDGYSLKKTNLKHKQWD